jgi:hypothetical protein
MAAVCAMGTLLSIISIFRVTGIKVKIGSVILLPLAFALLRNSPSRAQANIGLTYPHIPSTLSSTGFHQEFNTYVWNYQFQTKQSVSKKFDVSFQENFRSSMLRLTTESNRWKDDQNFSMLLNYQLLPQLGLQSALSSVVFKDNQSGFNNDVQTHDANFGLRFRPLPNFSASAYLGPKWDNRLQQNDLGTNFVIDMLAENVDFGGYDNNLQLVLGQDDFDRRKNNDLDVSYLIYRTFPEGSTDSLKIFDSYSRRDNYISTLADIESIREKVRGIDNQLNYTVSDGVRIKVHSVLQFKNVELESSSQQGQKQRQRDDHRISNDLNFELHRERLSSNVALSYWSQEQRYDIEIDDSGLPFSRRTAFVTPDNRSNRLSLMANVGYGMSAADSICSYFSVSRFQYDTPDTNNFDDRDELRMNSRLAYFHRFHPSLKLNVDMGVNLYHLVYIFGERSADNNWNRIFRLRPSLEFTPSDRLQLKQTYEVLANYVDYDFEDAKILTKSFIFRKFAMDDSLRWSVGTHTTLALDYRLQLEENGQLSWDQWKERILVTRKSYWLRCSCNYNWQTRMILSPGFTVYSREEWRHSTDQYGIELRNKFATYLSYGPALRFYYFPSNKLHITVDSMRQAVESPDRDRYYLNNIDVKLSWYF